MKFNALYDLAKRSLRSKKRNTRNTVFGLVFGMIIILPLIMLMLGMNTGMKTKLDDNAEHTNFVVSMTDYRQEYEDIIGVSNNNGIQVSGRLSGNLHLQELIDYDKNNDCTIFEQYEVWGSTFDGGSVTFLSLNGKKIETVKEGKGLSSIMFNVIDMDKNDDFFPLSTTAKRESVYVQGFDKGFEKNVKKQVVISERFLRSNNLKLEDFYEQNITISPGEDEENHFCKDYKVVGILSSDITTDKYDNDMFYDADFYFLSYDMYDSDGKRIIGLNAEKDIINGNTDSLNVNRISLSLNAVLMTYARFESKKFSSLIGLNDYIKENYGPMLRGSLGLEGTGIYEIVRNIYNIYKILMSVFFVIAILVIMIILLNMLITIYHNIDFKSQYLAMLESIGMKGKDVIKTYLMENFIIATKSNIIITIIALIFGVAIRIIGNLLLNGVLNMGFVLIPVWSIIVSILLGIAFIYAVTMLIAYVSARSFTKKNITSELNSKNQNN